MVRSWPVAIAERKGEQWHRCGHGLADLRLDGQAVTAAGSLYPHTVVLSLTLNLRTDVRHTANCVGEIWDDQAGRLWGLQFADRSSAASCLGAMVEMRRPIDLLQVDDAQQHRVSLRRAALPDPAGDGRTRIGYGLALAIDADGSRILVSQIAALGPADAAGVNVGDEMLAVNDFRVEGTGSAGIRQVAKLLTVLHKAVQGAIDPVEWVFRRSQSQPVLGRSPHSPALRAVVKLRQTRALSRVMEALHVYRDVDAAKALESNSEDFYATTWQPGYPDEDPISIRVYATDGGRAVEVECESPTVPAMRRLLIRMSEAFADVVARAAPESTLLDKHVISWDGRTQGRVVSYDRAAGLCCVRASDSGEEVHLHGSMVRVDSAHVAATQPSDAEVCVALRKMRAERISDRRNARIHPLMTAEQLRGSRGWRLGAERVAILEELIDHIDSNGSQATQMDLDARSKLLSQLDSLRALGAELLHHGGCISPRVEIQLKGDISCQPLSTLHLVGECTVLSHVDLGSCNLRDSGAKCLAAAVISNLTVRGVDVSCNELTAACCAELSRCIESSSITSLDISTNRLLDIGVQALANGIARSRTLDSLSISRNGIGKVGASAVAGAIVASQTHSLRSLTMGYNPLGDDGAAALADALAHPGCSLQALNLFSAEIGDAGAKAIAIAVASCESVLLLDLGFNCFDATIANSIKQLLLVKEERVVAADEKRKMADAMARVQEELTQEREQLRVARQEDVNRQQEIDRLRGENVQLAEASREATAAMTASLRSQGAANLVSINAAHSSAVVPAPDHAASIEATLVESLGSQRDVATRDSEQPGATPTSTEPDSDLNKSISADDLQASLDAPVEAAQPKSEPEPEAQPSSVDDVIEIDADDLQASLDAPVVSVAEAVSSSKVKLAPVAVAAVAAQPKSEPEPEAQSSSDDELLDLDALRAGAKQLVASSVAQLPTGSTEILGTGGEMSADDILASIDARLPENNGPDTRDVSEASTEFDAEVAAYEAEVAEAAAKAERRG